MIPGMAQHCGMRSSGLSCGRAGVRAAGHSRAHSRKAYVKSSNGSMSSSGLRVSRVRVFRIYMLRGSLGIQVYEQYLHRALNSVNLTYIGLLGSLYILLYPKP